MALYQTLPPLLIVGGLRLSLLTRRTWTNSILLEEIETRKQPGAAVFKLRLPYACLLIVLLAVVIASSGILLLRRKWGGANRVSPVGGKERAVESPLSADKRPKVGDEVSASSMRESEEEIVREFEKMLSGKTPDKVTPSYLKGFEKALEHFRSFVSQYKADLEGGEEKDEAARQRRSRWTLYKMQMATVTEKEIEALKQVRGLELKDHEGRELEMAEAKLREALKLKHTMARMWMKLATEDGLHPDSTKSETVLNLLKTQELHYWKGLKALRAVAGLPAPKASDLNVDTWSRIKELCEKLDEEDHWLVFTMP
ncbi:hypothetical protein Emed_001946 [Eimeria media]